MEFDCPGDRIGEPVFRTFLDLYGVVHVGNHGNGNFATLGGSVGHWNGRCKDATVEYQGAHVGATLAVNGIKDNLCLFCGTCRNLHGAGELVGSLHFCPPVTAGHGINAGFAAAYAGQGVRNGGRDAGYDIIGLAVVDTKDKVHILIYGELGAVGKREHHLTLGLLHAGEHGVATAFATIDRCSRRANDYPCNAIVI